MTSPSAAGIHHVELWTANLENSEPSWHWLLTELGWAPEHVDGWEQGRIWRHPSGPYIVLEQSADVTGSRVERCQPGMNHLALTVSDRARLDALRSQAPRHGWTELFGERYPHAGGNQHVAWYAETSEGFEVEVVAPS